MVKIYHEKDADLRVLRDKTIAIVGWEIRARPGRESEGLRMDVIAADTRLQSLEEG